MISQILIALSFFLLVGCNDSTRVYFSVATQSVLETGGSTEISVKLSRSSKIGAGDVNSPNSISNREIKVPFTVMGTAKLGSNHGLKNGTIVFPPNSSEVKIRVPILHNTDFEGDKSLIITLSNPEGASLGDIVTHTLTIVETDLSPAVNVSSTSQAVSEGAGTVLIPLTLEYPTQANAVIPLTFSGTAVQGVDFSAASSVTIPAGQTTGSIPVSIIDNLVINANKTVVVDLGNPTGAHLGTSTSHTITVVDNDNEPTVSFTAATQSVSESVGTVTVNFSMNKTFPLNVTIPYTVSGTASNPTDHNLSDGSLTIPTGSTTGSFSFNVVNNTMNQPSRTVIIAMGAIVNGNAGSPSSQTITINDDDPSPTVQFSSASQSVSEGVGTVTVRVNLSAVSGYTVQVPFSVTGTASNPSDHNLSNGTLTIPAGSTFVTTSFNVVDDTLYEANETVILTLGSPTHATASGTTVQTVTINNNDPAPTVTFSTSSQSVTEGNSGTTAITATVQLDSVSGLSTSIPFSVSGTATSGVDFSVSTSSPLVISAGSTSKTVTLLVTGDTTYENDETVVLTLGNPTNGTLGVAKTHTITILNDDPLPTVSFSASAQTVPQTAGLVYVLFVMSNPSDFTVTVPYTVSGTATYPTDHNLQSGSTTITPGNTTKVFTFGVVNESITQPTKTVIITMGSITNGTLGTPDTHTVSITYSALNFPPKNTKLWLDATYGVSTDGHGNLLEWIPRYTRNPISLKSIPDSRWFLPLGNKIPLIESKNWSWLSEALETKMVHGKNDLFYVVSGLEPEWEIIRQSDLNTWLKHFDGDLAELLWVKGDQKELTLKEIEAYLKQKYSKNHGS